MNIYINIERLIVTLVLLACGIGLYNYVWEGFWMVFLVFWVSEFVGSWTKHGEPFKTDED